MPKQIFTIEGANSKDLEKRVAAFEALQMQETIVLERLTELSKMKQAMKYLKSSLLFVGLKAFLNK